MDMSQQSNAVVDLCESDDDEVILVEEEGQKTIPSVARAPPVVSLLDDDGYFEEKEDDENDDGDDVVVVVLPTAQRKRPFDEPPGQQPPIADRFSDSKPAAKKQKDGPQVPRSDNQVEKTSSGPLECEAVAVKRPKTPLEAIYEVFPDVDNAYAQKLLFEQRNDIGIVLAVLAEGKYRKQKNLSVAKASSSFVIERTQALPKYDYLSPSSFEPSPEYIIQATRQLLNSFPFLSSKGTRDLMQKHKNHYSIVHQFIIDSLRGKTGNSRPSEDEEEKQYYALKNTLTRRRLDDSQRQRLGKANTVKYARRSNNATSPDDDILRDEIKFADQQLSDWMTTIEQRLKRRQQRKVSQQTGSAMECACCFDKVDIDEMVACREGHLFCVDCIQSYAENQIFSCGTLGVNKQTKKPALELLCCHGDGCQAAFDEAHLQKALPYKTLEKYNELQFQASVEQAGLRQGLCACPKCGFQADLPETQMIFECPVEDCRFVSCRKCGKPPHIPLRCEEVVQQKRQDEGRLKVEEAISSAKIRNCPKCKRSFVKSDGCNKMSCPCGVKMCYICRKELDKYDPYKHFCQKPHCSHKRCNKCTLYSNDEEDDARAMREAGLGAAEAYRQELRKEDQSMDVNIDVDKILRGR